MEAPSVTTADLRQALFEKFRTAPAEVKPLLEQHNIWGTFRNVIFPTLQIAFARRDVNAFIETVLVDPDSLETVEQQPFHREWQQAISDYTFILIAAPRGHGKTVQVSGRAVWELGRNTNKRIKIVGASDDKAKEILGLIHDLIENNEIVQRIFPSLKIDKERGDTKEKFFVFRSVQQRDPSVEASGWAASGAGGRADFLICDDVVDPKNSIINPAMREQVKEVIKKTWFGLLSNVGKVIWICTPYHQDDASHEFRDNGVFHVWWRPAIEYVPLEDEAGQPIMRVALDSEGKDRIDPATKQPLLEQITEKRLLWADYWTEEKLESRRLLLGERAFASQYLLQAMSDEDRTFPDTSLEKSYDPSIGNIGDGIGETWATFGGVDLAASLSDRGAWTVITTLALCPTNGKLYFKELWRRKVNYNVIIDEIVAQYDRHKWRLVFVENNAFQTSVEQNISLNHSYIPVQGFHTGTNKANDLVGLPGLEVAFSRGMFAIPSARFPLKSDDGSPIAILMDELRSHPGGKFSDTVMSLWFAYRASQEGQGTFSNSYLAAMAMAD